MIVALATTTIAWILMAVVVVGWIFYAAMNAGSARKEAGSEIELAANRKPYYSDEILEGRRLERVQLYGVLLLVVVVIGLPLYWVLEPDRQAGAQEGLENRFASWGSELFETTADGGFNCAGCHGGMNATGGQAAYTVTDQITGEVRAVDWLAPALNTVFYRFDEDEVRFILTYGRPGSPMSAWGLAGGGPMNAQQIDTLLPTSSRSRSPARTASRRRRVIRSARAATCRPRTRPTSRRSPARPSRTAPTPATARRCSTSSSPAVPTAAPVATPRAGATAIPASPDRAPSAGT